jgi:hypothetical protein
MKAKSNWNNDDAITEQQEEKENGRPAFAHQPASQDSGEGTMAAATMLAGLLNH